MEYTEIALHLASKDAETACALAEMAGIDGLYLEDYSDMMDCSLVRQINLVDEELLQKDRTAAVLHLYFEPGFPWQGAVEDLQHRLDGAGITYRLSRAQVEDQDWLNGWKKYYKPLRFGRVTVVPAWEDYTPADGETKLVLDPGLAFGTGSHETTACCIEALQDLIRPGDRVLDVGCGSGILGIAALLCGADYALGVDIDPNAARVAKENAALNPIAARYNAVAGNILEEDRDPLLRAAVGDEPYDAVAANIVADVIIPLCPIVRRHLKQGGIFIASGMLAPRAAEVKEALEKNGFSVLRQTQKKEWVCFCAKK